MFKQLRERKLKHQLLSHYSAMQGFAFKLCGNHHDAEDLVQQAYAQALDNRQQFHHGTRADSWMYRIIQNLYFNINAAKAVRIRKQPFLVIENKQSSLDPSADSRELDQVLSVIASIPDSYREVLILVCIQGFSYKETAELLQLPIGTVTSRLARGRKMIVDGCRKPIIFSPAVSLSPEQQL
ncbi:MAG: RNA polymerase sigma factor [Pseudomonadales bacterium]|nr:RNA polymerase sigma factor [Pseudomonadales bacterium]